MLEQLLQEFLIIFAVSTAVAVVFRLMKLPNIAGFIISGVIVGPSGFGLISDTASIQQISELGLIFLLFSIGVEFSLKSLMQMKRVLLGGGTLQMMLVIVVSMGILKLLGIQDLRKLFLMGSMLALSSTAIVLKALHQRREVATPHGNLAVGILLFQDLMVVPLMLLVPFFASSESSAWVITSWGGFLLKGCLIITLIVVGSRYVIPAVFRLIAKGGGRELFIIAVALLIIFSAWLAHTMGLSLALGAFIAGILIADSPFSHQATADVVAWRDPLVAMFFVSVGMLLDLNFFLAHPASILGATLALMLGKTVLNSLAGSFIGTMQRASVVAGLMLCQVGEFSFVLADSATKAGLLTTTEYQFLLSVIVLSLLISPLIIHFTPVLAPRLIKTDVVGQMIERLAKERNEQNIQASAHQGALQDHVIIVGFGNNGRNLAAALRLLGIPYRVIESNAATLREFPQEPIYFGDGGTQEILEKVELTTARAVVITINDSVWIHKIVSAVRKMRPEIKLIVRLQYFLDASRCGDIEGVDRVIAEAETAKQIVRKVLGFYGITPTEIESIIG